VPDTATVSVIVSGLVALGVPLLVQRVESDRRKDDARHERYDELRSVLDEASAKLMHVWQLQPAPEDFEDQPDYEAVKPKLPAMRVGLLECWKQQARIAMRTGTDSDVYKTYAVAHNAMGEVLTWWRHAVAEEPQKTDLAVLFDRASKALGKYFDAAAAYVGPERD
jgi:hypothetical protein